MSLETGGDQYKEVGEEYWSYHSNLSVTVSLVVDISSQYYTQIFFQFVKFSSKFLEAITFLTVVCWALC